MINFETIYKSMQQMVLYSLQLKDRLKKQFRDNGYSITTDQYATLRLLWTRDGISQIQICAQCGKDRSNMTRILDTMEKNGLVTRQPDSGDRRKFRIFLTEYGQSLKEPLNRLAGEYSKQLFQNLTEDELSTLMALLEKSFSSQ